MRIVANGIAIEIDDQGAPDAQPLLLIMGLGMQFTAWPEELVQLLVSRGFRVIRMDNRDIGLSQHFDHLGVPSVAKAAVRFSLGMAVASPYTLTEMAQDAVGVLDALGLPQAHVCGASMGGMIAQHLAAQHPQRVKSLTLMMTTSGARHLPQPGWRVRRALLSRPASSQPEVVVRHLESLLRIIGSPSFPPDVECQHQRLLATVRRSWHPAGTVRQLLAVVADGDRSALLPRINMPTRIIHGLADPLVRVAAGRELAAHIIGAQADFVPGMGHDLPLQLLSRFADGIAENAAR